MRDVRSDGATPITRVKFMGVQMAHDALAMEFTCRRGLLVIKEGSPYLLSILSGFMGTNQGLGLVGLEFVNKDGVHKVLLDTEQIN